MKIAIVGSGISGLVAARELSRHHDVHVFEAAERIGGHTHTVDVDIEGRIFAVDTGFIVFNEDNYPEFTKLMRELGVASRPTTMSFGVRDQRTGLEYNATSLNKLFAQRRNVLRPSFLRMISDILRFNRVAPTVFQDEDLYETVESWITRHRFSRTFIKDHLMPLGASLWSCPVGEFRRFPIRFLVEFLANHGMLTVEGRPTWRTIVGGSRAYLQPLTRPYADRIHTLMPVRGVRRDSLGVELEFGTGEAERFDHVVLACHSDQAMRMLVDPTTVESEILGSLRYQTNDVLLHTDTSVMPKTKRAWAAWNYRVADTPDGASSAATVTYDMNILQGLDAPVEFLVSLNKTGDIDPDKVIKRMIYEHPVFDVAAERARSRRVELASVPHTSYCGAYWGWGFHEDGVRSALAASRDLLLSRSR